MFEIFSRFYQAIKQIKLNMEELRDIADNFNTDLLFFGIYAATVALLDILINVHQVNKWAEFALLSTGLGCF